MGMLSAGVPSDKGPLATAVRVAVLDDPVLTFAVTVVVAEPGMDGVVRGLEAGKSTVWATPPLTTTPFRINSAMEVTSAVRFTVPDVESPKAAPIPARVIVRIVKRTILLFISFPPWE
jgi:hypothetical protein